MGWWSGPVQFGRRGSFAVQSCLPHLPPPHTNQPRLPPKSSLVVQRRFAEVGHAHKCRGTQSWCERQAQAHDMTSRINLDLLPPLSLGCAHTALWLCRVGRSSRRPAIALEPYPTSSPSSHSRFRPTGGGSGVSHDDRQDHRSAHYRASLK